MVIRVISLLALLASVAWFATQPSWESAATSLAVLAAFLGLEVSAAQTGTLEADRQLLRSFLEVLPSDQIIPFLREHDFGASFRFDNLMPLFHFVENWNNPEHAFHNRALNKKLRLFHATAERFLRSIAANTSSLNTGIQGIHPALRINDPDRYKKHVQELNMLADEVAKGHEDLIATCRRKLQV